MEQSESPDKARTTKVAASDRIPDILKPFAGTGGGIESWLSNSTPDDVLDRLVQLDKAPLSFEHLNQLLILSHEAGLSRGFYEYYWMESHSPEDRHPYDVRALSNYSPNFQDSHGEITSVRHLAWGLERFYTDGLLYFGNVRECYRQLRNKNIAELRQFFNEKCFNTEALEGRGEPLTLDLIPKENRYLIAEVACKTYDVPKFGDLKVHLADKYDALKASGKQRITSRQLLGLPPRGDPGEEKATNPQLPLSLFNARFSFDEILDVEITDRSDLEKKIADLTDKFFSARERALRNTELYLSMVYDLDAYVATSMRTRDDFRTMANQCEYIFSHQLLKKYRLRYFDPTLSAADSHEDKGLIECLMVKCAKMLIYMAGQRETYGKDAEAAMALSLGKPVIFLCDKAGDTAKFRDIHPLSRLIDFRTGVAVGAIVTDEPADVPLLIDRLLSNKMQYKLEKKRENYLLLKESHTDSVVRIQTDDKLLRETFWNYYHSNPALGTR